MSNPVKWTTQNIPSQAGRTAIVTGTGGLGFEDALALAHKGADVILAGRSPVKGLEAVEKIRTEVPGATVAFEFLDLANLSSVQVFAQRMAETRDRIDILINNAGVMVPPTRQLTSDGFELQFGTNYLGHFALTLALLPLLKRGRDSRVVMLSSLSARMGGAIDFGNLNAEAGYNAMAAYSQSKIACLMFAGELQRRSDAGGWGISSLAAHPGMSRTELLTKTPGRWDMNRIFRSLFWFTFQSPAQGALPTLYAATAPEAAPGGYYGPDGMSEMNGFPTEAQMPEKALDQAQARRLWEVSEQLVHAASQARPIAA
jgi:NAD(P)-dependent dehydrogenase (short-subunit alcohol dehydrogenase family)